MTTLSDISADAIEREWSTHARWAGIERAYDAADVVRLRGSVRVEHTPRPPRCRTTLGADAMPRITSTRSAR